MRSLASLLATAAVAATLVSGCDDRPDPELYLIRETSPFFETDLPHDPAHNDAVINAVRTFAYRNQMEFLLARQSLPEGEFNATAAGPDLNLGATHIGLLGPHTKVRAIARGVPTAEQRALAQEFAAAVAEAGASTE